MERPDRYARLIRSFAVQAWPLRWRPSGRQPRSRSWWCHRDTVRRACPRAPREPIGQVSLRVTVEYYAALLFFLAVSITHNGVWRAPERMLVPHDDWLRRSIKETARAYGLAVLCAWLLVLFAPEEVAAEIVVALRKRR
jgi:hypothetical protein